MDKYSTHYEKQEPCKQKPREDAKQYQNHGYIRL
jgi:hypothetical protein